LEKRPRAAKRSDGGSECQLTGGARYPRNHGHI
jgi:hypothetical protein